MKLISCHIKNFGKFSNKDYSFNDGITSIIENNGFGKSTLASFIKAMLYGMDMVKVSDKDFKDRTHYAPFNEQAYGGTLIFTHNQKEYRVERTFDVKSASKDELKIYVDKEQVFFEHEIGEELLGLDRESFDRLLFISSKDIKMESNGNIRKNLNNIIDDNIEGVDIEVIMNKLSTIKNKYSNRKNSDTSKLKDQKKYLKEEINNLENISSRLTSKYENRNRLYNEFTELNIKQQELADKKRMLECWETYNNKLNTIKKEENNLTELLNNYPNGYPTSDELSSLENLLNKKTSLDGESKSIVFDEFKKKNLEELKAKFSNGVPLDLEMDKLGELTDTKAELVSKRYGISFADYEKNNLENYKQEFKNGVPSDDDIALINEKITEYNEINTKLSMCNNALSENEQAIINRFYNKNPEDDLNKVTSLINEYKDIDNSMKSTPKFEEINKSSSKTASKLPLILLLISIVFVGAGIAMFFVMFTLGIIFTAVGVLGIFLSAFLYLKGRIDSNNSINETKMNTEYTKQEGLLRDKTEAIHTLLTPYGIYTDSVFSDVEKFKNDYDRYKEIKKRLEENLLTNNKYNNRIETLNDEISKFLSLYFNATNYTSDIQKLKEDIKAYNDLNIKYNNYIKDSNENNEAIKEIDIEIFNILSNYKIILNDNYKYNDLKIDINDYKKLNNEYESYLSNLLKNRSNLDIINNNIKEYDDKYSLGLIRGTRTLSSIISDINSINSSKKKLEEVKQDALKYKEEKNLVDGEEISTDEQLDYSDEIDSLNREIVKLDQEIDTDERDIDSLEEKKQTLNEFELKIKENEHRFEILAKLEEELRKSQKSLDDKYVAPIMEKFEYYSDLLGDLLDEKIVMGRDFDIKLDVRGQLKSAEHLSSGQRSICALCFRLALLDNIYNGDVPFIIMDDPFINLDKENLVATAKMLKELSKGKQIVYFSCHESRKI